MTVEERRQNLQQVLDSGKTQEQRNVLGQFSTPFPLAKDIVAYALNLSPDCRPTAMIEPACGTGVFFSAMQEVLGTERLDGCVGFEVDSYYHAPSAELWKDYGVDIRCADFLSQEPSAKFQLLVANPPYSRHHHIPAARKAMLQEAVRHQTGIKVSGLSGLYCYFMLLSSRWLQPGGVSCWLVPSEFMDVNYGEAVKKYLAEQVDLVRIHRFDARDLQFSDALVTSSIVVFRHAKPSARSVVFSFGGSLRHPTSQVEIERSRLDSARKWTHYFSARPSADGHGLLKPVLGDFFEVKRGIATGCNHFFVVNEETIRRYGLPTEYLTPILPAPRKVKDDRIKSENGLPVVDDRMFLFSTADSLDTIAAKHPEALEYIRKGEEEKVNETYICSRHTPWYCCEKRRSAPFVIPYMGRGENGRKMFRFILNESDAIATNGYLLMYPKLEYAYLFRNADFVNSVWKHLNDISSEEFSRNGRFYGGGLHKLEPRELLSIPVAGMEQLMGNVLMWVA